MHSKPHNNSNCVFFGPTMIGLKMVGRMSLIIYFIVSACCLVPEASFQLDHLKLNAFKASRQFIPCTFGSHHDRVKNGRPDESYHQFIVSACCLGPDASLQLDHLKLNEFKASQQFIQFIFGSHHDRVKNGGPDKSYHLFYSLCLLFRS